MKKPRYGWAMAIGLALGWTGAARGDTIFRTNGQKLDAVTIESATWNEVKYRLKVGAISGTQSLRASDVERFEREDEPRALGRGREARKRGQFSAAVSSLEQGAGREGPFASEFAYELGLTYLEWGAEDSGKLKNAVETLQALIEKHKAAEDWFVPAAVAALGDAYLLQGSVGLARNEFRKLTDASQYGERWRGEGYDGLGRCDLAEKKWEAAGQNFTVAFQAGVRRAHVGYARSQTGRKNYQLAVDSLERQFFLKKPEFDRVEADAHLAAGEAYEAWGGDHLWDAVYQYLWVSALYGVYRAEEAQALARAASLLDRLGAKEDAAQVLRRLRDKYPNSPPASKG